MIINNKLSLPAWLQEGRCIMIPKKKEPTVKDFRPITCLNTLYKAITSVIDELLKVHETKHNLMQIDQKGCKEGSMGCIDNLLIDKAIIEDAQINNKNITCVWVDVKKAFDSVSHKWLGMCLEHHGLPTKLTTLIKNIIDKWKITLEISTKDGKTTIGPITLKRGILQGDSFCVRLFSMCLNPISWYLRNNQGYMLSKQPGHKLTHLLYVDDLKTFHKSSTKAMVETRRLEGMFRDIGLNWGLDKCATISAKRGKLVAAENLPLIDNNYINGLQDKDHYKFLGKLENFEQLDQEMFTQASKEYLKRLSVIWSSNLSIPRKIKATNVFVIPAIQYHTWTVEWRLNDLRQLDRETRKIIREHGGMHNNESTKLLYMPTSQRGQGLNEIETVYKVTKVKVAHYLMRSDDPRLKLVQKFEDTKIARGFQSVFKDANRFAEDLGITVEFDEAKTVLTDKDQKTIEVQQASPKYITEFITQAKNDRYEMEITKQKWLGAFTTAQNEDKEMAPEVCKITQKWKNIPDIVYSVNTNIRQQLLPTKMYKKAKLQQPVDDLMCRMCMEKQETVTHIMSACPKIAQSLYTSRHDKMLRPYYHYLLSVYGFNEESDHQRPWYQQRPPVPVIENARAKILWNIEFRLEKKPDNNANKIDIALEDKEKKRWLLIEGTVCGIGLISDRVKVKQDKYRELRAGIKHMYKDYEVNQVNIVFDFLAGYHTRLRNDLSEHVTQKDDKETSYLLLKSQKWIMSQNVEIVKSFYTYTK